MTHNSSLLEERLLLLHAEKKPLKRFFHCHIFAQSSQFYSPIDKYPANTSHRFRFV
jgi:hypothetical protein